MPKYRGGAGSPDTFHSSAMYEPDVKKPKEQKKIAEDQKHRQELETALKDIPTLFDTDNFTELNDHLALLEEAQAEPIQMEGETDPKKALSIKLIKKMLQLAIREYSDPKMQRKVRNGEITEKMMSTTLAHERIGITRKKISDESIQGFRECIMKCIVRMCKEAEFEQEIEAEDEKNLANIEKRIEES